MNTPNACLRRLSITSTLAAVVLILIAGCGYMFRADGRPVGLEIKSLAIPLMTSTSSAMAFEPDFTKVIRQEFISHSKVPVIPREHAHMVLSGHVRDIRTDPLTYDLDIRTVKENDVTHITTSSRRLTVELEAKLVERETGRLIWRADNLVEQAGFEVDSDPLITSHNQRRALQKIAARLAKRVYLKTMERF